MGRCLMPLIVSGARDAGHFEDRRHDIDDVVELVADAADVLDVAGPGHAHALRRAAEMRRDLLGPLERRVERPRPACRKVREGLVRSPELVPEELILDRHGNAIEEGELVRRPVEHALGARAVVAADVDDQRVVELAHVLDGLDHPADLVVGVREVGAVDVGLLDEELLLVPTERIPLRQFLRPRRQLRIGGDDAQPFLVGEDGLAQFVPAAVEQMHVADLLDPLRRRMMRRVRAAGHVIDKERLLGRDLAESASCTGSRHRPWPWSGSSRDCPETGRWPSCCGTGSAATGWCRRRRSRRNTRSPSRSAIGRTARPGSPGKRACCGSCRTTRSRTRSPSGWCRSCRISFLMTES